MPHPLLQFDRIGKAFFGVPALREVSFSLHAGEILGLVGENGAGKSTLMNILAGILPADSGVMRLGDRPFAPADAREALRAGVAVVHQELNLFANLSIGENLFIADLPRRGLLRRIDWAKIRRQTAEVLQNLGVDLPPQMAVARLSPGERQLVEIAKGIRSRARVLVLDEPTTSLSRPEVERLFAVLRRLRDSGLSIIFISHQLEDVLALCDRVAVLRDGQVQEVSPSNDFSVPRLIELMVGRPLASQFPTRSASAGTDQIPLLEVIGLSQPGVLHEVSFKLYPGEILGVGGLMGSGRTELARTLFGLDRFSDGEIRVHGQRIGWPTPYTCLRQGLALLTESRRDDGLLMPATVADNVSLVALRDFAAFGAIRRRALFRAARGLTERLRLRCEDPQRQAVKTLSGGNQQKVVLAKWLLNRPRVLLLDEPTRGIDVGAKFELYRLVSELVAEGHAALWISSELEELLGVSDRILVMSKGAIATIVDRGAFDRERLLARAFAGAAST